MARKLLLLSLVLTIALPLMGLAAETTPETTPEVTPQTETPAVQYGPRWRWTTPDTTPATPPAARYADENNDGVCDNCGQTPGTNEDAPGYVDEDKDGVCDNLGTAQQGQAGRMQAMRGRMQHMQGRMQQMQGRGMGRRGMQGNMQGRGQGMMQQGRQGNVQGSNWQDSNNDGVCDHRDAQQPQWQQRQQPGGGPGRNWR